MIRATFAIPGDLDAPTGGYAYDRALLAAGAGAGVDFEVLALPHGFPAPGEPALAEAARLLAAAPADRPLLVDGLALGAMPEGSLDAVRAPLAALLHHPLALEAGLDAALADRLRASEGAALARAGVIVTTSAATAATAQQMFGLDAARFVVARPGVPRAAAARGGGSTPVLLTVASLIPRKGHDVLIDALAAIADLDWRAAFFGSDAFAPHWAAALRGRIEAGGLSARVALRGPVAPEVLDAAYHGADLFVLPSRYEGYGMVFAEAMAHGLPVVAADIAAAREVVPDAAGLRVPADDPAALAGALRALLCDPAARAAKGAAAHAHAAALPGWDATAAAVAAALRRLCA